MPLWCGGNEDGLPVPPKLLMTRPDLPQLDTVPNRNGDDCVVAVDERYTPGDEDSLSSVTAVLRTVVD